MQCTLSRNIKKVKICFLTRFKSVSHAIFTVLKGTCWITNVRCLVVARVISHWPIFIGNTSAQVLTKAKLSSFAAAKSTD